MSKQLTLSIPTNLYRRAKRIAESQQQAVADVIVAAIVLKEDEGTKKTAVDHEEAAFHRLHPILREKYAGHQMRSR